MNASVKIMLAAIGATVVAVAPALAAQPKPKISVSQAEAAAVTKVPGVAKSAKYEHEDGRWQYAVVVEAKKGGLYEVEVNSTTGKVLDMEKTSAAEEAGEAAADAKAAAKAAHGKSHK